MLLVSVINNLKEYPAARCCQLLSVIISQLNNFSTRGILTFSKLIKANVDYFHFFKNHFFDQHIFKN